VIKTALPLAQVHRNPEIGSRYRHLRLLFRIWPHVGHPKTVFLPTMYGLLSEKSGAERVYRIPGPGSRPSSKITSRRAA
jgi:hypothetical protein